MPSMSPQHRKPNSRSRDRTVVLVVVSQHCVAYTQCLLNHSRPPSTSSSCAARSLSTLLRAARYLLVFRRPCPAFPNRSEARQTNSVFGRDCEREFSREHKCVKQLLQMYCELLTVPGCTPPPNHPPNHHHPLLRTSRKSFFCKVYY